MGEVRRKKSETKDFSRKRTENMGISYTTEVPEIQDVENEIDGNPPPPTAQTPGPNSLKF